MARVLAEVATELQAVRAAEPFKLVASKNGAVADTLAALGATVPPPATTPAREADDTRPAAGLCPRARLTAGLALKDTQEAAHLGCDRDDNRIAPELVQLGYTHKRCPVRPSCLPRDAHEGSASADHGCDGVAQVAPPQQRLGAAESTKPPCCQGVR